MAKFNAAEVQEQSKKVQETIEKEKRHYRDQNFTELKSEDVERKLKRAK